MLKVTFIFMFGVVALGCPGLSVVSSKDAQTSCESKGLAIVRGPGSCAAHNQALIDLVRNDPQCASYFGLEAGIILVCPDSGN